MKGIIGLGNPLKADDGIGVRLIQELKEKNLPSNVSVHDAGTGGMKVLHVLKDFEKVIIVDAVRFGGEAGDFLFFTPDEVRSLNESKSAHDSNIFKVLELSEKLEELPEKLIFMGIEPKNTGREDNLSSELEAKVPKFTEILYEKIKTI